MNSIGDYIEEDGKLGFLFFFLVCEVRCFLVVFEIRYRLIVVRDFSFGVYFVNRFVVLELEYY